MILEIDNPTSPIITLCYKTSRFSAGHAVNIAHAFEKILMILLADPEQKIGGIDVLSESDWDQIQKWNGPLAPPLNLCVHQLLEQQAKLTPDATALCSWDGELSYQELDQMATRLAHHLVKEKGVRVESFVAFAFEKSLWAVIAMTGQPSCFLTLVRSSQLTFKKQS
jgi:non-ribosomal peptide synthetase component F